MNSLKLPKNDYMKDKIANVAYFIVRTMNNYEFNEIFIAHNGYGFDTKGLRSLYDSYKDYDNNKDKIIRIKNSIFVVDKKNYSTWNAKQKMLLYKIASYSYGMNPVYIEKSSDGVLEILD